MGHAWDNIVRLSLDIGSVATSVGFILAKTSTKVAFSVTREIASTASSVVDSALFGSSTPIIGSVVSSTISLAEQVTLAPLFLGEYITATSFLAAHSSIDVLARIFPGSSEASFSLASFVTLVRREWQDPKERNHLPTRRHSVTEVARALMAWGALQGVTQNWQEKCWLQHMLEIKLEDRQNTIGRRRFNSHVRVTSDIIYPRNVGQIISADIGEAPKEQRRPRTISLENLKLPLATAMDTKTSAQAVRTRKRTSLVRMSHAEMKATLRRLSKMVLAGYGGASLLFFGVSPWEIASAPGKRAEEQTLARAVKSSEEEAAGDGPPVGGGEDHVGYSWWDILLGKHDQEIFERSVNSSSEHFESEIKKKTLITATRGVEHQMPRFWVLTDHGRRQIVLVLRGTMSLNELAVDLTCEPEEFEPATTVAATAEDLEDDVSQFSGHVPLPNASGNYKRFPRTSFSSTWSMSPPRYQVHGGMLKMARAMGGIDCPVQVAVREALCKNAGYDLILCGHSLGAGVAALLGLMWADPRTCRTVRASGLPAGRYTSVYCFAPPCLVDSSLCTFAANLIVSFVYSHDVVARLSLGSVKDIRNAALWLCEAQSGEAEGRKGEGYSDIIQRAERWKAGYGEEGDMDWFIAVRKTLEANMFTQDLYPPGRVLWAMRDSDFHPTNRLHGDKTDEKLRLFEVLDVEKVFHQIVFAKDMLSAHLPHQYDRALHELI